jgi:hypothetical protein
MERSRKQNDDAVKSIKAEDWIDNLKRSRGISKQMGGLRSFDVAGGMSAEGAKRSRDVECRRKHRRGRWGAHQPLNASIYDPHIERLRWQYLENGSETANERLINYRE